MTKKESVKLDRFNKRFWKARPVEYPYELNLTGCLFCGSEVIQINIHHHRKIRGLPATSDHVETTVRFGCDMYITRSSEKSKWHLGSQTDGYKGTLEYKGRTLTAQCVLNQLRNLEEK